MKTNEAIKLLIDAYSGRGDEMDWNDVVIEPIDYSLTSVEPTNCKFWSTRSGNRSMDGIINKKVLCAKPHLTKPMCNVFNNIMAFKTDDNELGRFFIGLSSRFLGVYANNGDELGCRKEAVDIFRKTQVQIEHHNLVAYGIYDINDMIRFVISYIDDMEPTDLQSFVSYGAMYTHLQQMRQPWDELHRFMFIREFHNDKTPPLPMNKALVSLFRSTFVDEFPFIQDHDYLPESNFAQDMLRLSDKLFRIVDGGLHIPKCQLIDLLLVTQTITAISKVYSQTDDLSARARYEQGITALVDLTIKPASQKFSVDSSPYGFTGFTKLIPDHNLSRRVLNTMIQEGQDRPITGSAIIESAALRFNRQLYLELVFRAPKSNYFNSPHGKESLQSLADLARDGLRVKKDFSPLGKAQKLWLTIESDDEKTRLTLVDTHTNLRKETFIHDLGL